METSTTEPAAGTVTPTAAVASGHGLLSTASHQQRNKSTSSSDSQMNRDRQWKKEEEVRPGQAVGNGDEIESIPKISAENPAESRLLLMRDKNTMGLEMATTASSELEIHTESLELEIGREDGEENVDAVEDQEGEADPLTRYLGYADEGEQNDGGLGRVDNELEGIDEEDTSSTLDDGVKWDDANRNNRFGVRGGYDKLSRFLQTVEQQHLLGSNCTAGTSLNLGEGVVDRYAQERFRIQAEIAVNRANMLTR